MKKEYLIIVFLLLGPILDVFSFLGIELSIIIRGLFLVFASSYLILNRKDFKILIPLLIFSIVYLLYSYLHLDLGLTNSISSIFKFLYLPVTVLYFKYYVFPTKKDNVLTIILFTYLYIFVFSYLFNLGSEAYLDTDGKSGYKGLFYSINEFSAIVVCLLPLVASYLIKLKKYLVLAILFILTLMVSLLSGTKILLGGLVITVIYLVVENFQSLYLKRNKNIRTAIIVSGVLILVLFGFLFPKTRTYENMLVQNDFFKVEKVFSYEYLNRIIYNDRLTFLENNYDEFIKGSPLEILMGKVIEKDVEIDVFDILFKYGLIGFLVFISSFVYLSKLKKLNTVNIFSYVILVLVSLTSGHVLIKPAVAIYFALILNERAEDENRNNNRQLQ